MNYSETVEAINHLKSLNLKRTSNLEIKDLLRPIISIPLPVVFLEKGNIVIRCRPVSVCKEKFVPNRTYCTYAEFSNPKRKAYFKIGRANSEETTVFYGSIETEILNGFGTASFELLPTTHTEDETLRNLDFSTLDLVAGIWEIQRPMPVVVLGNLSENYINLNQLGHQRTKMIKDFLDNNPENAKVVRLVDKFLGDEFSKEVIRGQEYNYKISANYVDLLQTVKAFRGIIYPSVKSLGAGNNIVFFPKHIRNKNIKLLRGVYSIFYNRDNNCVNEYPMHGAYVNGKIRWEDYFNGKIPTQMRNFYLGRNDDDSFKKYIPMIDLGKTIEK